MRQWRAWFGAFCLVTLVAGCGGSGGGVSGNGGGSSSGGPQIALNEWTWIDGSSTADSAGSTGTLGVPSTSSAPSSRSDATTWTDASGNFWLFGGLGYAYGNDVNDLWKFEPASRTWTWVSGSAVPVQGPVTGEPGVRRDAASWIDTAGNLWLFGGAQDCENNPPAICEKLLSNLGDLWKFDPSTTAWTEVNQGTLFGSYGTPGVAAATNWPAARCCASTWTDAAGNFWLFGGIFAEANPSLSGYAAEYYLNDLWKYAPSTGTWTWVSGANIASFAQGPQVGSGAPGNYGTQGVPATANVPGGRGSATSWLDGSGNLWLFGGQGPDYMTGDLNDLWNYSPSTGLWTWVSGSDVTNAAGVYGSLGTGSSVTVPGARSCASAWTDSAGNLWLFGGDLATTSPVPGSSFNDLWTYSPSAGQWTWSGGSSSTGATGVYGSQGISSAGNLPGSRGCASSWRDQAGNLWLFGGASASPTTPPTFFNDLWVYGHH